MREQRKEGLQSQSKQAIFGNSRNIDKNYVRNVSLCCLTGSGISGERSGLSSCLVLLYIVLIVSTAGMEQGESAASSSFTELHAEEYSEISSY